MVTSNFIDDVKHDDVVRFFYEQQEKTPEAPAIQFHNEILNYDELNDASNRLANFLIEEKSGKNGLVGLCLERSLVLGISVLGILKSGAAYIPLDFEHPVDRISDIMQSAKCSLIITQQKFSGLFKDSKCRIIIWEESEEEINSHSPANPEVEIDKDDLLYVLFTSGSTGQAKGVAMRHEPLVNLMEWQKNEEILTDSARTLQYCSLSFDVSFQEILTCWSTGGCLFMIDNELRYNPSALLKFIEEYKIERLFMAFSSLHQLCRVAVERNFFPSSLKDIITGGEQLQITPDVVTFFKNIKHCKLHNHYGPTETNVVTTYTLEGPPSQWKTLPPIGKPVDNCEIYILDENHNPVEKGQKGELYVGGVGLAKGYINREDLTRESFIKDPFSDDSFTRMYKTGDLVRELPDGNLQYAGRRDEQVKIRGFRVELAEIELAIASCEGISQVIVKLREDHPLQLRLVAYIIPTENSKINIGGLKKALRAKLPEYMIPSYFTFLKEFPLTPSGKIDRSRLPAPDLKRPEISTPYLAPSTSLEKQIAENWSELLFIDKAGANDNFFDLGGNSLLAVQFVSSFSKQTGIEIPVVKLYEYSTIRELCYYLEDKSEPLNVLEKARERKILSSASQIHKNNTIEDGIAIIGMSGRFPGAKNVEEFWSNLLNGVESTSFFKPDELDPYIDEDIKNDPNYVAARGIVNDAEMFDAAFFGMNPKVAEITDPQQRVFLELAWEALEDAGYADESNRGLTGVFAGAGYDSYYVNNVIPRKDVMKRMGSFQAIISNEKDYLATLTSYMLDLKGPAMSIHTACSTSLVAVIEAAKSLRQFECDLALAGGISITSPVKSGHLFTEGSLFSSDGHTRTFSADATGTIFSDGAGIVVLKRYKDAVKDGDRIYAAIRGIGINNDGHDKASFAAPSMQGQASVIAMAQADANIDAESISYIEAHGTATPIGDPIEIEALTTAFRSQTQEKQFCAIGSVKSNFGHLTAAAGVTGLIKTALALKHKIIPASINYTKPNPSIDFANSPFYVNTSSSEWKIKNYPRRAGVSSFGFGGTNAHVILEEVPGNMNTIVSSHEPQLLILSAKTDKALKKSASNLVQYLEKNQAQPGFSFADVAFTLQTGRKSFNHKKVVIANDVHDAIKFLHSSEPTKTFSKITEERTPRVAFIFPDQENYFANMGWKLYESEKVFSDAVNECCKILNPIINADLKTLLFPKKSNGQTSELILKNTPYMPIALFVINYASAMLFINKGVTADVLLDGTGGLVAACISGAMSLNDALKLVAASVKAAEAENLTSRELLLKISKTVEFHHPKIPVISAVRAERIDSLRASDPQNWLRELNDESHFSDSIQTLWNENPDYVLLVFGLPTASTLSLMKASDERTLMVAVFGNDISKNNDRTSMLIALGQLWLNGISFDWKKVDSSLIRNKIDLPTYPFEGKRYWIDPPPMKQETQGAYLGQAKEVVTGNATNNSQNVSINGLASITTGVDVNHPADQNMMVALLMNQMQMQQQLMAMMLFENSTALAKADEGSSPKD